jgi:hypothetical protein
MYSICAVLLTMAVVGGGVSSTLFDPGEYIETPN